MSRSETFRLAIISDIHYAGPAEQVRRGHILDDVKPAWRRWLVNQYRHWFWLRDACAHNHLLDRFIVEAAGADFVVANGDYSCDSEYIGVSSEAAFQSASECLGKLRTQFNGKFAATPGDHEFGKKMLAADLGGLRLASLRRAEEELGLQPFWQMNVGRYVLMGVTSTLLALAVYEPEALAEEMPAWSEQRAKHFAEIRAAFHALRPEQRVLLFCHDPTALPFLWREDAVRQKIAQVERTIIGHLHSPLLLKQSRLLAGLPTIGFLGHTPKRLSAALREARHWKPFNILLCPSPPGIQLLKDGGYFMADLDPECRRPAAFQFRPMPW